MSASAVAVREAATVMLVRDAPRLEVFMVRRSPRAAFVPGAYVFPGGQVDADDATAAVLDRAVGLDLVDADSRLGTSAAARFWVAALRETFEEAGVLVARTAGGSPLAADERTLELLAEHRRRLLAGESDLTSALRELDAHLDLGALVPIARWITPPGAPRRFDTWFFVVPAPAGHAYAHDDDEMVASEWVQPDDALARARAGEIELIYPTIRSLLVMRRYERAQDFVDAARDRWSRPNALRVMDPALGWQLDLTTEEQHDEDGSASSHVVGMDLSARRRARAAAAGG